MIWHILQGLGLLLAAALVGAMVFFKFTIGRRDSWKRPEEKSYGGGERKALVLYQPSNGRHNVPLAEALAKALARLGYAVTVNHPSDQVEYDPMDYELLAFGTPVYMGETARPLRRYLEGHPFSGKKVLCFVTGRTPEAPELESLQKLVGEGNEVRGVKVQPGETEKLLTLAGELA